MVVVAVVGERGMGSEEEADAGLDAGDVIRRRWGCGSEGRREETE